MIAFNVYHPIASSYPFFWDSPFPKTKLPYQSFSNVAPIASTNEICHLISQGTGFEFFMICGKYFLHPFDTFV